MKAYLVLDLKIHDFHSFREYIDNVPSFIRKHGGRYIVQGSEPIPMEGDWRPERMVILEFPARENATAFLGDPEFKHLLAIRHRTTTSNLVLVDGCS
ncbi:MAG: DUF1330 domain-containing protein [Bradyrhizobium sp.]|nr:DUF1330 domain-containing protein [Bradyrhizobium sp.]